MKDEFDVLKEQIETIYSHGFVSLILKETDEQIQFISKIGDLIKLHIIDLNDSSNDEHKLYTEVNEYHSKLLLLLEGKSINRNPVVFGDDFSELLNNCNNLINLSDTKRFEVQDADRFHSLKEENVYLKLGKLYKRTGYFISTFPGRTSNLIRSITNHKKKPLRLWRRKIYFRNLCYEKVRNELLSKSLEIIRDANKVTVKSIQTIWTIEEKINKHFTSNLSSPKTDEYIPDAQIISEVEAGIDSAGKFLRNFKADIQQRSDSIINEIFNNLDELYPKAGTFEFPSRKYSDKLVEKTLKEINEKYTQLISGWANTLFTLLEDWKLNKDIFINEILEVKELYQLKKDCRRKIIEKIIPGIDKIKYILQNSIDNIERKKTQSGLSEILTDERLSLRKILSDKLIEETIEALLGEEIPQTVDQLEKNLKENILKTSKKRAIVKTELYDKEIRSSEIEYIEPSELIRFEILPDFIKQVQKLKSTVVEQIDDVQKKLGDIDEIADFNLESALAAINSEQDSLANENAPEQVALKGLKRSISKTEEIKSQLVDIHKSIINSFSEVIGDYNNRLLKLTNSDNIIEIRLRIAKAKAIEKTRLFRTNVIRSLKNIVPQIAALFKKIFLESGKFYKSLRDRFGLEQKKIKISAEISDFLAETENAINKLPYVYQRLFRIEPLVDEKFYEQRLTEINRLKNAFKSWQYGHYAPAVLIGEKGSGLTTTINIFLNELKYQKEFFRTDITQIIYREDDLLKLLQSLLQVKSVKKEDVISFLNSDSGRKVIVLENIHHLYLRTVGGFIALKLLFEIISGTNKNVFWLISCNLYAWNYLERVLNISDYFAYVVKLQTLSDEQIIDIILKRHRVSGYNIKYEPSTDDLQSKAYQKLTESQQQNFLKEKYFSGLNKFARSNLSISLFFWMRSTREVSGDTINIGSLEELDFSFLLALSDDKIFTLYILLTHDGLTTIQHSAIFRQSIEKSRLTLLLLTDDGIIIKIKDKYIINPLLYRQTVTLLQSKNILH
jgi:hypothetical protein